MRHRTELRNRCAGLIAAVVLLAVPAPMLAWGNQAHQIICDIALVEMADATRTAVEAVLAGDSNPAYRDFAAACLWGDREGKRGRYERFKHLHYLNAPRDAETVNVERDCGGDRNGCVLTAIAANTRALEDAGASAEAKRIALKFLLHFVGDVHQPLHVSYADDRGGNEFFCSFFGRKRYGARNKKTMNLHAVWDSQIVGNALPGGDDWDFLARELQGKIDAEDRAAWSDLDAEAWANESFELTRRQVYRGREGGQIRRGDDLVQDYFRTNLVFVKRRLQQAGFRLARLLDRIYAAE